MSDQIIQEIKDKLDIADVVGRYVQLKKSGANLKGLCPFHHEKTSSFMVSPSKQIWHCFGCGEGGDVLGFIKRYENVEFGSALQMAAELAGVDLPNQRQAGPDKNFLQELIQINDFTTSFFEKALQGADAILVKKYLQERGLMDSTIKEWRIGWAPDSFDQLYLALQKQHINIQQALLAGVLGKSEHGKIYDRFRGRIIFPICDYNGNIVAFSARIMPGATTEQAKYINSPETPLYNKSKIVFGLNFAKDMIRHSNQAVIVEGQMDVITAHQAGFKNTVATSGTALTIDQLRQIKRLASSIILAFDNDPAGQQAQLRAGLIALGLELETRVIDLKDDKDPDELIKNRPSQWDKLLRQNIRIIDYYLEQAQRNFLFGSLDQKQYIIDIILPLVNASKSPIEIDHYYNKISTDFAINEHALRQESADKFNTTETVDKPQLFTDKIEQAKIWEKEILGGIIIYPEFLEFVKIEGLPDALLTDELVPFFQEAILGNNLMDSSNPLAKESIFMVESNLENLSNNELALIRELKKSFFLFKLVKLKYYLQELTIAIKKAEVEKNIQLAKQLGTKFAQLTKVRFEIETKLREA